MASVAEHLRPNLHTYLVAHSTPEDPLLAELAAETAQRYPEYTGMQIGPEQGLFMTMLAQVMGARRAVEVGTFTGYSSVCIARGLADGGLLTCCDISEDWTSVARSYWQKAGLEDRVELRLGPAIDTLRAMPAAPMFDLAFIDADKPGYIGYWDEIVPRMRSGGVILVDNTFMHGRIFEPQPDESAQAIKEFNDYAFADKRVDLVMLPVGDGLTMAHTR
ncbi:MAG TPA: O-methyltransferase [Streptosporangiaceae bacterium]|nr:O-methyltransferase [Streptosporangiaceae bacterium]